ncbi:peptide chain release factor 2 [Candidatus Woesebacteria bacterium RIFCSPHIGHO2_01_FULL_39_23]|nr:MAG: peptide chain release factor 2 [Candidatus Woesebacteria bacterium RIFCSPHIGHO2_01_FULL_39_23]
MQDVVSKIEELTTRFKALNKGLNLGRKMQVLKKLEAESSDPDLWKDPNHARDLMQKIGDIKKQAEQVKRLEKDISDLVGLSDDKSLAADLEKEVVQVEKELEKLELTIYLSGPYDEKNAVISIHAGQGGTEAMDWAQMLLRMYLRFCERWSYKIQIIDETTGEEAGIKSVTFRVDGRNAYGYLKNESGTHRLVRQSPYNADKLRQTSFASVEVLPDFADIELPDIEIKEDDLEWQFFRSSSQGGQNVQKVSTAVRLIHKPTGIVVSAQAERFQEQNRRIARSLLRAKLWLRSRAELEETKKGIKGEYRPASWGTQIRSYVLHPYKMVKDLRTNVQTSDTEAVLNGELDEFIESGLKLKDGV